MLEIYFHRSKWYTLFPIFLIIVIATGTYLHQRYEQLSYTQRVNLAFAHKKTYICYYRIRYYFANLIPVAYRPQPTPTDRVTQWLEKRVALRCQDPHVRSVKDLPFIERQILAWLDAGSAINAFARRTLCTIFSK